MHCSDPSRVEITPNLFPVERASLRSPHNGANGSGGDGRPSLLALEHEGAVIRRGRAENLIDFSAIALDALMLVAAGVAAAISAPAADLPYPESGWLSAFSVGTLALLAYHGVYRPRFAPRFLDDVRAIIAATAVAAISVTFVRVLIADDPTAAAEAARAWLFAAVYMSAGRGGVQLVRSRRRRSGLDAAPTLILGAGRVGDLVARRLAARPEFGLRPVAFFDHDPLLDETSGLPVLGQGADAGEDPVAFAEHLDAAIREFSVRHVIVTFSLSSHEVELALVRRCQELGVSVSLVPRLFEGIPDQTELERIGGLPLISVYPIDPKGWQFAFKYMIDRVFAVVAILVSAPLMTVAALGTLITLGRPILFRQRRIGMDGHEFEILKFRTMHAAPEVATATSSNLVVDTTVGPGGVEGDDRRSGFGALLRRTSLDELPQLFNVLRGDMSLIGPRPERPGFAAAFKQAVHRYGDRHRVKSGITGWAQVHGLRGRTSLADRVEWDNYYIENWSLWLDFKILVLTLLSVFRDRAE